MHLTPGVHARGIRGAFRPLQPAGEREIDDRKRSIHNLKTMKDSDMPKRLGGSICALFVIGPIIFAQTDSAMIGKAEAVLKNLQDGRYAEVVKEFNPVMEKAIPEEKLRAVWEMLTAQFGAVKSIDERRSGELKGYRAVELILSFERERVVQRVVFDSDGKIAGLAYQPASMAVLPAAK